MVKLILKSLSSPDVEPGQWVPNDNRVFILLQLEVGAVGRVGCDVFDVVVATPEGLTEGAPVDRLGAISRRALIVLRRFAWDSLQAVIEEILHDCEAGTWEESVLRLLRYFAWEFEDYADESKSVS